MATQKVKKQPLSREERVRQILTTTEAVLTESHFVYTSELHGSGYVNKDAIYPHTREVSELCEMFAEDFKNYGIEVVAAPAIGGVILSHATANQLRRMTGRDVLGIYAEKKEDGGFEFRRGYDNLMRGKRVLVVEDVLTTGNSIKSVIDLVQKSGGEVIGLGAICNRGGVRPEDLGINTMSTLINLQMNFWPEEECELCHKKIPIDTRVGKGKEYLSIRKK